jgi:enamine deaminase RidA (YjgF/YER057c/UK114 family)
MMSYTARLAELGITLPKAAAPVASYVPVVVHGGMAYVSGQLPFVDGQVVKGRLGEDVDVEEGQAAARACGLMIMAQLRGSGSARQGRAGGEARRLHQLHRRFHRSARSRQWRLGSDGAGVRRQAGKHARAAVGVPALPRGAAVEVDAIIALKA